MTEIEQKISVASEIFEDLQKILTIEELSAMHQKLSDLKEFGAEEGNSVSYSTDCLMARIFWKVYDAEREHNARIFEIAEMACDQ